MSLTATRQNYLPSSYFSRFLPIFVGLFSKMGHMKTNNKKVLQIKYVKCLRPHPAEDVDKLQSTCGTVVTAELQVTEHLFDFSFRVSEKCL